MEALESCQPANIGVACLSPLDSWPSPPAAHTHPHTASNSHTHPHSAATSHTPHADHDRTMSDTQVHTSAGSGGNTKSSNPRQNQVGNIMLHGVAIVSLVIDNKERLCLAQISNTLLKDYSYNEIHNRRVALGITCVQCTPVQLEILRRAGAMPVSSRRCGMITKREAERLVKSFLEENAPPKLPDDFAFDVHHECGWGCRGLFEPSRYNSSRAKCIKCFYCHMYFSPNKFIFHFHRTPDAKYNHPDAANFNSWRRHLKLFSGLDSEEISYKWEDVKAMFNGGTRKRVFSQSSSSSSSTVASALSSSPMSHLNSSSVHFSGRSSSSVSGDGLCHAKKVKTASTPLDSNMYLSKSAPFTNTFNPYSWLGKPYPFMAVNSSQSLRFGMVHPAIAGKEAVPDGAKAPPLAQSAWLGRYAAACPFSLSSMDFLWDKTFGFPQAPNMGFRNGSFVSNPVIAGATMGNHTPTGPTFMDKSEHIASPCKTSPSLSPPVMAAKHLLNSSFQHRKLSEHQSAFTRVVPLTSPSPTYSSSSSSCPSSVSPSLNDHETNNPKEFLDQADGDRIDNEEETLRAQDLSTHKDSEDCEEIDVEEDLDDRKRRSSEDCHTTDLCPSDQDLETTNPEFPDRLREELDDVSSAQTGDRTSQPEEWCHSDVSQAPPCPSVLGVLTNNSNRRIHVSGSNNSNRRIHISGSVDTCGQDSGLSDESDTEPENNRIIQEMSREDFREDVVRDTSIREQMAQQLEVLKATLTTELEQERQIRMSLQLKLREAQDALQNLSSYGRLKGRRDNHVIKGTVLIPR